MDYFISSPTLCIFLLKLTFIAVLLFAVLVFFFVVLSSSKDFALSKVLPLKFSWFFLIYIICFGFIYSNLAYHYASPIPSNQYAPLEVKITPYLKLPKVKRILKKVDQQGYVSRSQKNELEYIVETVN